MGFVMGGLKSLVQSAAATLAQLVGQDIVARSFTSSNTSTAAIQLSNSGFMSFSLADNNAYIIRSAADTLRIGNGTASTLKAGLFSAGVGSGSDAFSVVTNGARWHIGAGASDYLSSDGTTCTFAGPMTVTGVSGASSGFAINGNQKFFNGNGGDAGSTDVRGNATNGASGVAVAVGNAVALTTAGAKALRIFSDSFTTEAAAVMATGAYNPDFTDDSANSGNRTVNKPAGQNAIAIGAATCTITNSVVKATSVVVCVLQFADATATTILRCIPAAGSFTLTVNANATAATKFGWIVFNGN